MRSLRYSARICLIAFAAGIGACHRDHEAIRNTAWSDPRSAAPEAAVYRTWLAYLASKGGAFSANAGTPSPLWVTDEQRAWPMYDLAGYYLPDGAVPHVVSIQRVDGGSYREYEIVTRFASSAFDSSTALTMTAFAVMDGEAWRIANALPRRTRSWYRKDVGPITYFVEPGLEFNPAKAAGAVAFVDSIATVFALPRLSHLDYYVTSSADAALQSLGVEFPVKYGPHGGFSKPVNLQLFSGIPALGEAYRHELTHVMLRPLIQGKTATVVASEGIATWFGGTSGSDYNESVKRLAAYLRENPRVSLDSILGRSSVPQSDLYAAGAVLCAMLADHGGVTALKKFLVAGPGAPELKGALVQMLERPWAGVAADWRERVERSNTT